MLPEEGLESPDCGITLCLMSTLVRVQHKGQMTIPSTVRSAVGLADGDMVEVRAVGRKIVITPQLMINRSKFPTADGEYTPRQRRIIDATLAEAEKGPYHGPFKNGAEIAAFMKGRSRSTGLAKSKKPR
jgi:AbrB family looped-hinge helix DNA binding protein